MSASLLSLDSGLVHEDHDMETVARISYPSLGDGVREHEPSSSSESSRFCERTPLATILPSKNSSNEQKSSFRPVCHDTRTLTNMFRNRLENVRSLMQTCRTHKPMPRAPSTISSQQQQTLGAVPKKNRWTPSIPNVPSKKDEDKENKSKGEIGSGCVVPTLDQGSISDACKVRLEDSVAHGWKVPSEFSHLSAHGGAPIKESIEIEHQLDSSLSEITQKDHLLLCGDDDTVAWRDTREERGTAVYHNDVGVFLKKDSTGHMTRFTPNSGGPSLTPCVTSLDHQSDDMFESSFLPVEEVSSAMSLSSPWATSRPSEVSALSNGAKLDEDGEDLEELFYALRKTHHTQTSSFFMEERSVGGSEPFASQTAVLFEHEEDPEVLQALESSQSFSLLSQTSNGPGAGGVRHTPPTQSEIPREQPDRRPHEEFNFCSSLPAVRKRRVDLARTISVALSERSEEELLQLRHNTSFSRVASGKVVFQTAQSTAKISALDSNQRRKSLKNTNTTKKTDGGGSLLVSVLEDHRNKAKVRRVHASNADVQ